MKIVFAASEAAPFIKTGGLGDVAGALPTALAKYQDNEVILFLPYYKSIKNNSSIEIEAVAAFETSLSWRKAYVGLMRLRGNNSGVEVYFIDNEYYFDRDNVYGEYDDGERFAFFSKAVLEALVFMEISPDVIHCNDWQTALIPTLLHAFYGDTLGKAKTVFTIHNIEYQGWAHPYFLGDVLGLGADYESKFEWNGSVNFVKGAILTSDVLTTVSRTYANELKYPYFAHGLSSLIEAHAFKLYGIVNGIDTDGNNPATDRALIQNYTADTFHEGKAACKSELQKELGLPIKPDVPLIGIVSRLVGHKGFDIVCAGIDEILNEDVQLVILGTGDAYYEQRFKDGAARYPEKMSLNLTFNRGLASRVYAASDIYLMPSKSEPCGLSQLLAMRYGSVPVVHETGGLRDTVTPFNDVTGEGYGFTFQSFTKEDMLDAIRRAMKCYLTDNSAFEKAVYNGMSADFSWEKPAGEYIALYEKIT